MPSNNTASRKCSTRDGRCSRFRVRHSGGVRHPGWRLDGNRSGVLDGETGRQSLLEFWPIYAAIQVGLMGAAEKFRTDGTGPAGFVPFGVNSSEKDFKGLDPINPGGPLDFFNVAPLRKISPS